jgi:hypothetical protein
MTQTKQQLKWNAVGNAERTVKMLVLYHKGKRKVLYEEVVR